MSGSLVTQSPPPCLIPSSTLSNYKRLACKKLKHSMNFVEKLFEK